MAHHAANHSSRYALASLFLSASILCLLKAVQALSCNSGHSVIPCYLERPYCLFNIAFANGRWNESTFEAIGCEKGPDDKAIICDHLNKTDWNPNYFCYCNDQNFCNMGTATLAVNIAVKLINKTHGSRPIQCHNAPYGKQCQGLGDVCLFRLVVEKKMNSLPAIQPYHDSDSKIGCGQPQGISGTQQCRRATKSDGSNHIYDCICNSPMCNYDGSPEVNQAIIFANQLHIEDLDAEATARRIVIGCIICGVLLLLFISGIFGFWYGYKICPMFFSNEPLCQARPGPPEQVVAVPRTEIHGPEGDEDSGQRRCDGEKDRSPDGLDQEPEEEKK